MVLRLKYSLLLTIHPNRLFPHVRCLKPTPSEIIAERSTPLFEARRKTIIAATQPYSLVLDADTKIPNEFLERAYNKLLEGYLACSLYYSPDTQGHPPFGASLWLTSALKRLYDYPIYVRSYKPVYKRTEDEKGNDYYNITNPFQCECLYMWAKLGEKELSVFDDLTAEHRK